MISDMKTTRSRKGAPGLIEVAARAGVSPATVSRYFNNPDIVKPDTKARIANAAASLGYIRDRMAGTLHNRFSGTIGLIVPTIDNAIFAEFIEAFGSKLRENDRNMLIASHGYNLTLEVPIVRSLLERRIDGVVLIGLDHDPIPLDMLAQRNIPVISAWNYRPNSTLPCIGADNRAAGAAAAKHLLDLGHRDIAFVFPDTTSNDRARDRLDSALATVAGTGHKPPAERLYIAPYDIGEAKAVGQRILSTTPPTAIICGNDVIAQGIVYACQSRGISIPRDLSVIGIGDFSGSAHMEPGLTTLRLPAKQIGREVAETILKMSMTGLPPSEMRKNIDVKLIIRKSTKSI